MRTHTQARSSAQPQPAIQPKQGNADAAGRDEPLEPARLGPVSVDLSPSRAPRSATHHRRAISDAVGGQDKAAKARLGFNGVGMPKTRCFPSTKHKLPPEVCAAFLPSTSDKKGAKTPMRVSVLKVGAARFLVSSMVNAGTSGKVRLAVPLDIEAHASTALAIKETRRVPVRMDADGHKKTTDRRGRPRTEYVANRPSYERTLLYEIACAEMFGAGAKPLMWGRSNKSDFLLLPYMHADMFQVANAVAPTVRRAVAYVFATMAAGHLKGMHDHGIAHGDFKGGNVLADLDARTISVADFGRAVPVNNLGKLLWLASDSSHRAPESVRPELGEVGLKIDMWALGAAIGEQLVGREMLSPFYDHSEKFTGEYIDWRAKHAPFGRLNLRLIDPTDHSRLSRYARRMFHSDRTLSQMIFDNLLVPEPNQRASAAQVHETLLHQAKTQPALFEGLYRQWSLACASLQNVLEQSTSGQVLDGLTKLANCMREPAKAA